MSAEADLAACREAIRTGSRSFHAASRLLPRRWRDPALALYAFCRCADDAVDARDAGPWAVAALERRLARAYEGRPENRPADRAFAAMVDMAEMPRTLPEALIEGFAWDAEGRRYDTLSGVRAYSARVAASVGAMMAVIMERRSAEALARACDLGVAMQLTNIARDIGEDARAGRLYLPLDWLDEAGIEPARLLADPAPSPALAALTRRLLAEADRLYARAEPGIPALPPGARPAIFAARHVYAAIGGAVARQNWDSVSRRAVTGPGTKAALGLLALARAGAASLLPQPAGLHARPLPETAFLVAAARRAERPAPADRLAAIFADLRRRDAARIEALRARP